jgi:hypothetical protein
MSRRFLTVFVVTFIAILATSLPSHAQGSDSTISSKIPFEFMVGDKAFPAGDYRFVYQPRAVPALQIQGADGKHHAGLTVIARLAKMHEGDAPKASFVFDKVGEKHYLSEIWMPGQDGYLVHASKNETGHDVVDVK